MFDSRKRKRHSEHSSKRNHRRNDQDDYRGYKHHRRESEQDPVLFIQAHEADLRRGPQARELAKSLEVVEYTQSQSEPTQSKIGNALIHWAGGTGPSDNAFDEDEDTISLGTKFSAKSLKPTHDASGISVDRFDARLLLDALPNFDSPPGSAIPGSPDGWSNLPSDTEEMFFFSPEEADDYRNEKRRRVFEQAQEERVKARLEEDKLETEGEVDDDPWGGSDEEPDDAQKELMLRTATHLLSSPNPAQLEMRILANHGADKRFAFLKGRWSHAWLLIKAKLRREKGEKERNERQEKDSGLGLLAGYDSASGSDTGDGAKENQTTGGEEKTGEQADLDEKKKEVRRQKAKEWAERKRAEAAAKEVET